MKRTFVIIFLMIVLRIYSSPVSLNDASAVAEFYLELYCDTLEVDEVIEFKDENKLTVAYIIILSPSGFIALSVDTNIQPIIAYSFNNDFIFDDDPENVLYHVLLNDMIERIDAMNSGTLPNVVDHNTLWSNYLNQNLVYFNQRDRNVSNNLGHFSSLIFFIITSPSFRYFQVD